MLLVFIVCKAYCTKSETLVLLMSTFFDWNLKVITVKSMESRLPFDNQSY
ncbi:MAG: hypothetical protein ACJATI_005264 [Halioglobus sp.]|jgi:hypothetical protein